MWILEKPLIDDAINDIAFVIAESKGVFTNEDRDVLSDIYKSYDNLNGHMTQELENKLDNVKKEKLYDLYDCTQKGRKLYYIRKALMDKVTVCPMCGIKCPTQLDHHSPRSKFKSMSVSRLNLVPICGECNNKKGQLTEENFIHPYYDRAIENLPFFVISICSDSNSHRISWKFSINDEIIGDKNLADRINKQVGVVKLYERLNRETNEMLSDFLSGIEDFSDDVLSTLLHVEYKKHFKRRGLNDWHTVFIKALMDSPSFTKEEAKVYVKCIKPVNGGVNA